METPTSTINEGKAKIYGLEYIFYNPVQEFNRDLSVAALSIFVEHYQQEIKRYRTLAGRKRKYKQTIGDSAESNTNTSDDQDGITILEALSATGLRSIRYALEVPNVKLIYANDISPRATQLIKRNVDENKVGHIVTVTTNDAVWLMHKLNFENKHVDVVDLDPYGCPSQFLDAAVGAIHDGGLLMVTCTDMAIMAGNTPESCYVKYGAISLRNSACHEMAIRIALQCIANYCGRYGKYIVPLLSISADFYIRTFVRVFTSQEKCKQTSSKLSLVYQCTGCGIVSFQPLGHINDNAKSNKYSLPLGPPMSSTCEHCGHRYKTGGPIWTDKIHDEEFLDRMITFLQTDENRYGTSRRMLGMLSVIKEELHGIPLYYTTDMLCQKLHCTMIPLKAFRSALLNGGYRVSMSHCHTNSIKTNAPANVLWDILRHWVQKSPISEKRLKTDPVSNAILQKKPEFLADFTNCIGAVPLSAATGLLRFQKNPTSHWGPGTRSRGSVLSDSMESKSKRNQNKRKNVSREDVLTDGVALSDSSESDNVGSARNDTEMEENGEGGANR